MTQNKIFNFIKKEIDENEVVLFLKGTSNFPACGFSSLMLNILELAEIKFKEHNVLENEELRQGIKDFSDWPTIPQLYVKGKFIGGSDIVREMYEEGKLGELAKTLSTYQNTLSS